MKILEGYKTYIIAVLIALFSVIHGKGWIDEATWQTIMGLLVGGGLATTRAALDKKKE